MRVYQAHIEDHDFECQVLCMLSDSEYYSYCVNNNGDSCSLAGTAVTVRTSDVELEAVVQDGTSRRLLLVSRPGQAEQAPLDAGS